MSETSIPTRAPRPATVLGLVLALIVPTVAPFIGSAFFGTTQTQARIVWGMVFHWADFAALLAVVLLLERERLGSVGLKRLRWWTIPLGLLAGVFIIPVAGLLSKATGAGGDAHFVAFLLSLPFATRLLLVLTAGIFEETLFRGYALERLAVLFKNKWWAAAVTVALFTVAHIPAVGVAHLLPVFIISALVTLLYLWRRDLVVNILAHVTIDGVALLAIPLLRHHGSA